MQQLNRISINIKNLKRDINNICLLSNRKPHEIKIVAASKYAEPEQIIEACNNGIKYFGENRAEELIRKYEVIKNKVIWHFIGHLQSRKAKLIVPIVDLIHSVDSLKLIKKINNTASDINKIQDILIEINISGESTKFGICEDEVDFLLKNSLNFSNIRVRGFMTIAPLTDDLELIRNIFKKLKNIFDIYKKVYGYSQVSSKNFNIQLDELSMGMSNDYKIAIQEGATMIRIGSLIFL